MSDSPQEGRERRGRAERTRLPQAERRRQILRAATRIVGQRGYYGFSMQDVADACSMTVAGVLHHVGTKDGLLIALLQERDRRDLAAVTGDGSRAGLPGELSLARFRELLRGFVVRNSTQPELVRLYSMLRTESLYRGHPAYEYFRERDARVLADFTRAVTGKVPEPLSTARQLLALMGGLEEQWLRDPDAFDLVAEWDRAAGRVLPPP
ncbi:TetR/AcrR family transcriptional regulator [Streptomyces aidingensis]|uniref:DNA-binding transcriptional regulator, AcrR family n=1 Tax=Streptomyces aidingensis TaxID=910347 RepID=A0A1I1S1A0_9ACTN|nr:TetR/AcrR family transcriptional regulator [Streptomyces aidingensis]SFD40325.1 DNA-binding transcriptional regulator, AcrR family [Streptomyces aidingensis]